MALIATLTTSLGEALEWIVNPLEFQIMSYIVRENTKADIVHPFWPSCYACYMQGVVSGALLPREKVR